MEWIQVSSGSLIDRKMQLMSDVAVATGINAVDVSSSETGGSLVAHD